MTRCNCKRIVKEHAYVVSRIDRFFRSVGTKLSGEKNEKKLAARCRAPILGDVMNNTETKIKKGHLYVNTATNRVERIVEVRADGTVAHRHHSEASVSLASAFRTASREEVLAYLGK